jgi:hypothetical protein
MAAKIILKTDWKASLLSMGKGESMTFDSSQNFLLVSTTRCLLKKAGKGNWKMKTNPNGSFQIERVK